MSKFNFTAKAAKFRSNEGRILDLCANNAVVEFKVNAFDNHGLNGQKWAPNKVQTGRQQLVDTSRMRNSIRVLKRAAHSRTVGTDVPYAEFHNKGTAHLPQRKFIGRSKELEAKNKALILREIRKIV